MRLTVPRRRLVSRRRVFDARGGRVLRRSFGGSAGGFPVSPLGRVAPFLMLMPVCTVAGGLLVVAAVTYIHIEKER